MSPSTVIHIARIEFRGNEIEAKTSCGVDINIETWRRLFKLDEFKTAAKCNKCFGIKEA